MNARLELAPIKLIEFFISNKKKRKELRSKAFKKIPEKLSFEKGAFSSSFWDIIFILQEASCSGFGAVLLV